MTQDELHLEDAKRFKETVKQQFVDYRSKFRSIVNEVRTVHYDSFAQLGVEKESHRVATEGNKGRVAYDKINDEVRQMKERLKAAGVNRIIAGINDEAAADEEYYSEEEEGEGEEEKDRQASPSKLKQGEAA